MSLGNGLRRLLSLRRNGPLVRGTACGRNL